MPDRSRFCRCLVLFLAAWCLCTAPSLAAQSGVPVADMPPPEGYDKSLWRRALDIHRNSIVVDTHSDTTSRILDEDFDMSGRAQDGHMDLPRIFESGLDVQIYSIYVAASYYGAEDLSAREKLAASKPNASARRALDMIDGYFRTVDSNPTRMQHCASTRDIESALRAGKHAALMGIEGGHAIEGDLGLLRQFARLGVRYMTLTHSNHNEYADSSGEATPRWNGLNRLGVKVVREMNRLGMMVDVSHVADTTFFDALKATRAPVICSHSSCRALASHRRNVTDEMLTALAKNGGVIQINFNCGFLSDDYQKQRDRWNSKVSLRIKAIEATHPRGTPEYEAAVARFNAENPEPSPPDLAVLIDHIEHAIKVAGPDHVGLGSDFDGVPCVPRGVDDVTHLPRITYWLLKRGHSPEVVAKVLGGNLMRVFREVERVALSLGNEPPARNGNDDFDPIEH
ncbi:MAG: dipeptidase [Planctomycetota bacterium]